MKTTSNDNSQSVVGLGSTALLGRFRVRPCTLAQANEMVARLHRHHKPAQGHRFSLALFRGDSLVAVAICGRPVARMCDAYGTLEIIRCASDGTRNAISKLYGHVCRAADAMGFHTVQTYTLPEEGGASMKAAGFHFDGESAGGQWKHTDGKQRRTDQPTGLKWRWVKRFPHNADAPLPNKTGETHRPETNL